MANDPQFGAYSGPSDPHSFQIEVPEKKRSMWQTCLIGCLVMMAVLLLLALIAGFWVSRHWREWAADLGSQVIDQGIESSDLPQQEKVEVKQQVDRVATAFRAGQISNEQATRIFKKIMESPLMPMIVVMAVDKQYLDKSGLKAEEKAQGRLALERFARGVFDKKIDEKSVDSVMLHIADRQGPNSWKFRQHVSDDELRAAIAEAKAKADAAGIGDVPQNIDPSDEIKRIIDESMNENPPAEMKK